MSGMTPDQVVEFKHAMAGMAEMTWSFFEDLKRQGFSEAQALTLAVAWLRQTVSGAQGE